MTEEELAKHDSKTLLQLLLSADARCDALTADFARQVQRTDEQREAYEQALSVMEAERDGLLRCVTDNHVALCRAEKAEAERDRMQEALAMIDAIDPEHHIDGCAQTVVRGLVLRMGETARAALKGETP